MVVSSRNVLVLKEGKDGRVLQSLSIEVLVSVVRYLLLDEVQEVENWESAQKLRNGWPSLRDGNFSVRIRWWVLGRLFGDKCILSSSLGCVNIGTDVAVDALKPESRW